MRGAPTGLWPACRRPCGEEAGLGMLAGAGAWSWQWADQIVCRCAAQKQAAAWFEASRSADCLPIACRWDEETFGVECDLDLFQVRCSTQLWTCSAQHLPFKLQAAARPDPALGCIGPDLGRTCLPALQIVAVPSLQSGGMENVGLNTFDASHILACPATATDDDYQNVERAWIRAAGALATELWQCMAAAVHAVHAVRQPRPFD